MEDMLPGMPQDPGIGIGAHGMPAPQQPSKFGARDIIGIIGEALGGAAGNGPGAYTQMKVQDRQQQRQDQLYQQRQGDEQNQWLQRELWKQAHPDPVNNDTVNDFNFLSKQLGPEAAKSYLQNLADGPPVAIDVAAPDGSVTRQFLPRSSIGKQAPAGPAPGTVVGGHRFKGGDPNKQESWEPVGMGGQGSATPGTFPVRP